MISHFGDLRLSQISPFQIDLFISSRKVKPRTLNNELSTLKKILDLAIRWNHLKENPFLKIRRPRIPRDEISCLSLEQVNQLLNLIPNSKARMIVEIAAFTGMRIGEILGLRWSDVDFENSKLRVERTVWNGQFQSTKTESGDRVVKVPQLTLHNLKLWRLKCPPTGLVFPNRDGGTTHYDNFMVRYWRPALKKAGLPSVTFHSLRHSNISLRLMSGQNLKYIASQIGHRDVALILNRYGHLLHDQNFETQQHTMFENAIKTSNDSQFNQGI